MLAKIRREGYSRIPVCKIRDPGQSKSDPRHTVGFILGKHLITVDSKVRVTRLTMLFMIVVVTS